MLYDNHVALRCAKSSWINNMTSSCQAYKRQIIGLLPAGGQATRISPFFDLQFKWCCTNGRKSMTLQEVQKQALQLPINARWQLVQTLLESLQQETRQAKKKGNLSRLRDIAKSTTVSEREDVTAYTTYLIEKYQ